VNPKVPHFALELSGQGCDIARQDGWFEEFLTRTAHLVSRIDIASDIETVTRPLDFSEQRTANRQKTSGRFVSPSGETVYIGSQKSEQFVRVYRYENPHPRGNMLRVEHVFRREHAKLIARICVDEGTDAAATAAGKVYGWQSPLWDTGSQTTAEVHAPRAERNGGKTVFWLVHQVAPAFRRMIAEGLIDNPEQFVNQYFLNYTE